MTVDLSSRLSLTVAEAAAVTGFSETTVRAAYQSGALTVRYGGEGRHGKGGRGRVVIEVEALRAWLASLPTERSA